MLAYNSPIKYWLCIRLVLTLIFGDSITSGKSGPGISMHLQSISFDYVVYITYYFSVVLHIDIKHTEDLFAQAFTLFYASF